MTALKGKDLQGKKVNQESETEWNRRRTENKAKYFYEA